MMVISAIIFTVPLVTFAVPVVAFTMGGVIIIPVTSVSVAISARSIPGGIIFTFNSTPIGTLPKGNAGFDVGGIIVLIRMCYRVIDGATSRAKPALYACELALIRRLFKPSALSFPTQNMRYLRRS